MKRRRSGSNADNADNTVITEDNAHAMRMQVLAMPEVQRLLICGDVRSMRRACTTLRDDLCAPSLHSAMCACLPQSAWHSVGFARHPPSLQHAARALLVTQPHDCSDEDINFLERAALSARLAFIDLAAWTRWSRGSPRHGGGFAWRHAVARLALNEGWPVETLLERGVAGVSLLGVAALQELVCNATLLRTWTREPSALADDDAAARYVTSLSSASFAMTSHQLEHHGYAWALAHSHTLPVPSPGINRPPTRDPPDLVDSWDTGLPVGGVFRSLPSDPARGQGQGQCVVLAHDKRTDFTRQLDRGRAWARCVNLWKTSERALRLATNLGAPVESVQYQWLATERLTRAMDPLAPMLQLFGMCSRASVDRLLQHCDAAESVRTLTIAIWPAFALSTGAYKQGVLGMLSRMCELCVALPPLCTCTRNPHKVKKWSQQSHSAECTQRLQMVARVARMMHMCTAHCIGRGCTMHTRDAPIRAVLGRALREHGVLPKDLARAAGTKTCFARVRALLLAQ